MLYLCMLLTGLKKVSKAEGKSWLWNLYPYTQTLQVGEYTDIRQLDNIQVFK